MDQSRQIALDVLIKWHRDGSYPNLQLKNKIGVLSEVRQRAFVTGLVYGIVEKKMQLDYLISKVSSVPLRKIHIVNLSILRMGLYQIMFMSVPRSAACNTSVELAKRNGQGRSSGFINAVLRKLSSPEFDASLPTGNDVLSRSIRYSVDTSIIQLLDEQLGEKFTDDYLSSLNDVSDVNNTIAVNTLKTDASSLIKIFKSEGVEVVSSENNLITVRFSNDPSKLESFRLGLFHIIGKPSYVTAMQLDVLPGQTVIDLCSAPGGKTFVLAYLMKNQGRIIACDIHPHKIDLMKREARRLGIDNVEFCLLDATKTHKEFLGIAHRVLCDVPCSGLGIMRKKPDIRYKDLKEFSLYSAQKEILINGGSYLKSGGKLVYSTCTINPLENHGIVEQSDLKLLSEKTFLPQCDNTEGFYFAKLLKE